MKNIYCWKCKDFIPMLEQSELARYRKVHRQCIEAIKNYRCEHEVSLADTPRDELVNPAYVLYEELTGFKPSPGSFDHIWHHSVEEFGPECKSCGRQLSDLATLTRTLNFI